MTPVVVIVVCRANEGDAEVVAERFVEMAAASRQEPGCMSYAVHRGLEDSNVFALYEVYTDRAAYEKHVASEYYDRLVKNGVWLHLAERHPSLCSSLTTEA